MSARNEVPVLGLLPLSDFSLCLWLAVFTFSLPFVHLVLVPKDILNSHAMVLD